MASYSVNIYRISNIYYNNHLQLENQYIELAISKFMAYNCAVTPE